MSVYDHLGEFPAAKNDPRGFRKLTVIRPVPPPDLDLVSGAVDMTVDELGEFNFGAAQWGGLWKDCFRLWSDAGWPPPDCEGHNGSWLWVPGDAVLQGWAHTFFELDDMAYGVAPDEEDDDEEEAASDEAGEEKKASTPTGKGDCEIQAGDCITSIGFLNGLYWKRVWDHPDNAELKRARKHPNILLPGDKVTAKDESKDIRRGSDHKYRCIRKGVPGVLRLRFTLFGLPRKNEKYEVEIDGGNAAKGTLNADGALECKILPTAETAVVYVGERRERFEFALGQLPPANTIVGWQARLANLNYYNGPVDGERGPDGAITPQTAKAMERFLERNCPDEKMTIDLLRKELVKRHGS